MGIPLEGAALLVSFFADDDFPPFGIRLAIFELFLSDEVVSSLGDESFLSDLLFSSLSLEGANDLLPFAEDFEYDDEEEEEEEDLLGAVMVWVLGAGCLDGALLGGSSPYSDMSSSSCSAISTTEGDTLEPALGLISLNFSSMDL